MSLSLGWLAGALSTLSPCVLPLVPILLLAAFRQHRLGPLALAAGLIASFTAAGTAIAAAGFTLGLNTVLVRDLGAILLIAVGAILMMPRLQVAFAGAVAPFATSTNGLLERFTFDGLGGQFLLGTLLGLVWSPCTGPTLGAAVGMAAQSRSLVHATLVMVFFGLGAATPILVLAYGSRQAIAARRDGFAQMAKVAKPMAGALLLILGVMISSGLDRVIEAKLTAAMPVWLVDLTARY